MKIAVIPARGGSKRIPRKNIRSFLGKPILSYSVEAALSSEVFDRVIVSTDCEIISETAVKSGAEVPFVRPAELSNDYCGTSPVVRHAINWVESSTGEEVTGTCCIYPTAVFISADIIKRGWLTLQQSEHEMLVTVAEFGFPIQRALRIRENGSLIAVNHEDFKKRSQDLEHRYHDAGQMYWGRGRAFRGLSLSGNSIPLVLPRWQAQDIDTEADWEMAEILYKASLNSPAHQ